MNLKLPAHNMETTGDPRVSVIVPAWNVANYLGETIASLLAQTYNDFKIIVVDDGSKDNKFIRISSARHSHLHRDLSFGHHLDRASSAACLMTLQAVAI